VQHSRCARVDVAGFAIRNRKARTRSHHTGFSVRARVPIPSSALIGNKQLKPPCELARPLAPLNLRREKSHTRL
jgi:hypothetical protein